MEAIAREPTVRASRNSRLTGLTIKSLERSPTLRQRPIQIERSKGAARFPREPAMVFEFEPLMMEEASLPATPQTVPESPSSPE